MRLVLQEDGCFAPFDDEAKDMRDEIGGEPFSAKIIEIELLHDRDMIAFRRIMATINEVAHALHTTPEKVRAELLVATGNFTLLGDVMGTPMVSVNSMARRAMKDHELHVFWAEAKEIIRTRLLERITDPVERDRLADHLSLQSA